MSNNTTKAEMLVETWLRDEHGYQFRKNRVTHAADPRASLDYIVGTEIGNKWKRFQMFNRVASVSIDPEIRLQAGQQLLKACAAARGALVWRYALDGYTVDQGSDLTRNDLRDYYAAVDIGRVTLPATALLEVPLEEAIHPATISSVEEVRTVRPIFTQLAGLAIVHLMDQQKQNGYMVLPKPGTPSGHIESWVA